MTRALDLPCPNCNAPPSRYCAVRGRADLCQARINAAVKQTRDANLAARKAAQR